MTLRGELDEKSIRAHVNGTRVLNIPSGKSDMRAGRIGLWVDIWTEGGFANLRTEPR